MHANDLSLPVTPTTAVCAVGETIGRRNAGERAVPVLSCEGACIRGEIARLAANRLAATPGYRRACHGELFTVPASAMARWVADAPRVVVIDGCHLRCHGRIVERLVPPGRVHGFNAQARHRKFGDLFEIDSVPEADRKAVAGDVAGWVARQLQEPGAAPGSSADGGCGASSGTGCT